MLGLNVTLVGITVVFLALIILSFILSLFSKIFAPKKKASVNQEVHDTTEMVNVAESHEQDVIPYQNSNSDEELIAVLTAAVMASMSTGPDCKIRVKSFRRIPQSTPVWNIYGRKEYLYEKL